MARNTNPPQWVVDLVHARSGGICEVCLVVRASQQHHRRPRGMGGTRRPESNRPSALLDLCHLCHDAVERNREWARDHGYLVRQEHDPAAVPVKLCGRLVLLDDAGGLLEFEPAT